LNFILLGPSTRARVDAQSRDDHVAADPYARRVQCRRLVFMYRKIIFSENEPHAHTLSCVLPSDGFHPKLLEGIINLSTGRSKSASFLVREDLKLTAR
jgi:hypothetical protein